MALSEQGWRLRLEELADRAESMIGRKTPDAQLVATMALELVGLVWPALGPETLAASCRASLAVGYPGLLMAATPFDQAAEIAARLDDIWQAAQDDPSAAVVTLTPPLMQQVVPPGKKAGRPRRVTVEPELITQAAEPDHSGDAADIPEPVVEDHPGDAEPITQAAAAEPDAWGFPVETAPPPPAKPEPAPAEPIAESSKPPTLPDTTGWFSAADAAELLGLSMGAIARRRRFGQLGQQGVDWLPAGRSIVINPAFIERLLSEPPRNGVPETHGISAESSENGSQQLELVAETQS